MKAQTSLILREIGHAFNAASFVGAALTPFPDTTWPRKETLLRNRLHLFGDNFKPACLMPFNISSSLAMRSLMILEKHIISSMYSKHVVQC